MNYGPKPTGRENMTVYYCRDCSYESDHFKQPEGVMPASCPDCRHSCLHFVRYEAGVEDDQMLDILNASFNQTPRGKRFKEDRY
jgi:DNA-directed RNA polymerase subunit RPC12/RpoP